MKNLADLADMCPTMYITTSWLVLSDALPAWDPITWQWLISSVPYMLALISWFLNFFLWLTRRSSVGCHWLNQEYIFHWLPMSHWLISQLFPHFPMHVRKEMKCGRHSEILHKIVRAWYYTKFLCCLTNYFVQYLYPATLHFLFNQHRWYLTCWLS